MLYDNNDFMKKSDYKKIPFRNKFSLIERVLIIILSIIALVCAGLCVFQIRRINQLEATAPHKVSRPASAEKKTVLEEQVLDGTVLSETKDAGWEYVDDTLFLGDSNTVRFMQYYNEKEGRTYTTANNTIAVIGMGAQAISTLPCMRFSIGTFTMIDSAVLLQPRRIILTFGTNNLDGFTNDASFFIDDYERQIMILQEAWPYADLIIQSIFPIAKFNEYPNLKVSQIRLFNAAIMQMCDRNGWKYLNTFDALYDTSTGYAREGMMDTDGLHLSEQGAEEVFRYIRTHAYIAEDRRPQPLEEIPYVIGPLTELYETNPLNNEPFIPQETEENTEEEVTLPEETLPETPEEPLPETPEEPVYEEPAVEEPPAGEGGE